MHSTFKIIITPSTNKDVLKMFMDSYERMPHKDRQYAPTVLERA